ncbi:MAG: RluA family pseudouridine synthase [Treponema sp.]|nr:RluA family pseudouridine synthase [Treponema sp.]
MPAWSGRVGEPGGLRLDRYTAEELGLLSRSQVKARKLEARVNGRAVKVSRLLKLGDFLELSWEEAQPDDLVPEDIPLDIIYENERVIVVNKAQGMVVHPGSGNFRGTLANALLYRRLQYGTIGTCAGGLRPGIVHRLDKDTSGVMIAAWDEAALAFLQEQFRERTVRKTYAALVRGAPPRVRGRIETRIVRDPRNRKLFTVSADRGKAALTLYRLVWTRQAYSLLLLRPRTGRTHQIRVHLRHLGCPILGDPLYGREDPRFLHAGLMLHAAALCVRLPGEVPPGEVPPGEVAQQRFRAPLPARFREIFECLASL